MFGTNSAKMILEVGWALAKAKNQIKKLQRHSCGEWVIKGSQGFIKKNLVETVWADFINN